MTSDSDRLCPCRNVWSDTLNKNRSSENSSVKNSPDSAIRGFPHFLEVVFRHSCSVRCDSCTLNSNAVFLCSVCRINSYLIVGLISMNKAKIIVFCFKVNIWSKKNILISCQIILVISSPSISTSGVFI